MATNQTTNYQLNQWETTDQVLRTDFNADNAKIDAPLAEVSIAKSLPKLAFYIGQLGLVLNHQGEYRLQQRSLIVESFQSAEFLTLSSGVSVQNGVLCLNGAGATGTMMSSSMSLQKSDWTRALIWIHLSGGTAVPTINNVPLSSPRVTAGDTVKGVSCLEYEYAMEVENGTLSAQVKLDLTCGSGGALRVYDYCLFFF